uniref:Uncharacterized protein n=1 Tax=Rhodnius prolixus TaxID=13249 RepID=T1I0B0_RHOPR
MYDNRKRSSQWLDKDGTTKTLSETRHPPEEADGHCLGGLA